MLEPAQLTPGEIGLICRDEIPTTPAGCAFHLNIGYVIEGLNLAVQTMRVGEVLRVVIPGGMGYQNRQQQPIPREFSDRQRLYTTIFNPTRIANGEGESLGALIFDVELLSVRPT